MPTGARLRASRPTWTWQTARRRSTASSSAHRGCATSGPRVEVLAELDGEPVLLRDGQILVAAFHPELTDDPRIHERFLELVTEAMSVRA